MSKKESRKQFLKRFGFGLFNKDEEHIQSEQEIEIVTLNDEQLIFLEEYEGWLSDFHGFIKRRNSDPFNVENNKRLMELSAEAETRKEKLEELMEDVVFATVFNKITEEVSKEI